MEVSLRELYPAELPEAARLVARAMCDNPVDVRVFALADPARRDWALTRFFSAVLRGQIRRGSIIAAYEKATIVGAYAMTPPGDCQPSIREKVRILATVIVGNPPGTLIRVLSWVGEWSKRDPVEPHWHLGPVAVAPEFQGRGVGTAMITDFCSRLDTRALAYLETDKAENVRLYQRFGFKVVAEAEVLGVHNWFMSRRI
jgi:ribosomal protein S18 acetylase RimI-like enzyme